MFGLFYITRRDWKAEAVSHGRRAESCEEAAENWARLHDQKAERLQATQSRLDAIIALETPNPAHGLKKAIRIARGEPAPVKAKPVKVEAGPVPEDADATAMRGALEGTAPLSGAFYFSSSAQGRGYWQEFAFMGKPLTPKARSIIETWIAELEAKAEGGAS